MYTNSAKIQVKESSPEEFKFYVERIDGENRFVDYVVEFEDLEISFRVQKEIDRIFMKYFEIGGFKDRIDDFNISTNNGWTDLTSKFKKYFFDLTERYLS